MDTVFGRCRYSVVLPVALLAVVLVAPGARSTAWAGGDQGWRTSGPVGGWVRSLAFAPSDPTVVYATGAGVFRSADGGASWIRRSRGLSTSTLPVFGVAVRPDDADTAVIGAFDGIYRTTDGGVSWTPVSHEGATSVAFDPVDGRLAFGAAAGTFLASVDAGATWRAIGTGLPQYDVDGLLVDPTDPSVLYAGSEFGGVYKTVDGGHHWFRATGSTPYAINALAMDPQDPDTIYAGDLYGVWRTEDAGATWTEVSRNLPSSPDIEAVAIDPRNPATLYVGATRGGVWISTTGGEAWTQVSLGLPDRSVHAVAVDPSSSRVLAGTMALGVFELADPSGWHRSSAGLLATDVRALATDPSQEDRAFAGLFLGLATTATAGASWSQPAAAPAPLTVSALAVDPSDSNVVYAGTSSYGSWRSTVGLYRSTDGGRTWTARNSGMKDPRFASIRVTDLAVAPSEPQTLYASVGRSNEGGTFFQVFGSLDGGASWVGVGPGLPSSDAPQDVVVDPVDATVVYVGDPFVGVYKSTDRGVTWAPANDGLSGGVLALAIGPSSPNVLYTSDTSGVYRSDDGAVTWVPASRGLPRYLPQTDLAVDPTDEDTVYASVPGDGVYWTQDGGLMWNPLRTGLADRDVTVIVTSATGEHVYVGSSGTGVFVMDEPDHARPTVVGGRRGN